MPKRGTQKSKQLISDLNAYRVANNMLGWRTIDELDADLAATDIYFGRDRKRAIRFYLYDHILPQGLIAKPVVVTTTTGRVALFSPSALGKIVAAANPNLRAMYLAQQEKVHEILAGLEDKNVLEWLGRALDDYIKQLPQKERISISKAATRTGDTGGRRLPHAAYIQAEALARLSSDPAVRTRKFLEWYAEYQDRNKDRLYPFLKDRLPESWFQVLHSFITIMRVTFEALRDGELDFAYSVMWKMHRWSGPIEKHLHSIGEERRGESRVPPDEEENK